MLGWMVTAPWALLVGDKGADKSALALRVATALGARGLRVEGVVQDPLERDGERSGYVVRRIGGPETVVVARKGVAPPGSDGSVATVCSFVFDAGAFEQARAWVRRAASDADVVVIDEVSKLEVARGGHHAAIVDALGGRAVVLLVVRGDQLFSVVERFGLGEAAATLESGDEDAFARFVDDLARAAAAARSERERERA
jgi:nucleoside-triphosphatase THEP1